MLEHSETVDKALRHTLNVIGNYGIEGVTTKRISKRMNMSTGILHHYFGTKNNLIYHAYAYFIEDVRQQCLAIYRRDISPKECLLEFGFKHFSNTQTTPLATNIWLNFWHQSSENNQVSRLLKIHCRRTTSNFVYLFKQIHADSDIAKQQAHSYYALIQGIWLGITVSKTISKVEAKKLLQQQFEKMFFL